MASLTLSSPTFSQRAAASVTGQSLRLSSPSTPAPGRRTAVTTQAIFGGGGGKKKSPTMVCEECGYIYRGDFSQAPAFYRCPGCLAGKGKFKAKGGSGGFKRNAAKGKKEEKKKVFGLF